MAISKRALSGLAARPQTSARIVPSDEPPFVDTLLRRRIPRGEAPTALRPVPLDLERLDGEFGELGIRYESDQGSLWCEFGHRERPCFTPDLLHDISALQAQLKRSLLPQAFAGKLPVRALVWHSSMPDVWNLGGDLALFIKLIRGNAREDLRRYAYACVDTIYQNWTKLDLPVMTIALVQGDALGGGFEAVLTNDVVIAERQSKFGLPEILFNMFPGMGAYSLLCRRLDGVRAEQMIRSGRLYEAQELAGMGLVDQVVERGEGPAAVRAYLDRNRRRHGVLGALAQVRRRCQPLTYEELVDVTDVWVDTAMDLDEADLRRMERLAGAQHRRHARAA